MKRITAVIFVLALLISASATVLSQSTPAPTPTKQPETTPVTMHVSSIHKATEAEKTYHTAFGMQFIEGTIGNLHYTLSDLTGWAGGCGGNWEIGKDYEVVKSNPQVVVMICGMDRKGPKGKPLKLSFNVATVSEEAAK